MHTSRSGSLLACASTLVAVTLCAPTSFGQSDPDIGRGVHTVFGSLGAAGTSESHLRDRSGSFSASAGYALRPVSWLSIGPTFHAQTSSLAALIDLNVLIPYRTTEVGIGVGYGYALYLPYSDHISRGVHLEMRVRVLGAVTAHLDAGAELGLFLEGYEVTILSEPQGTIVGVPIRVVVRHRFW
jgi:hypothetical protein